MGNRKYSARIDYSKYINEALNLYNLQEIKSASEVARKLYFKYKPKAKYESFRRTLSNLITKNVKEETSKVTTQPPVDETEVIEDDNGIKLIYKGGKPLTSKAAAIKFFKIDTKEYEVEKFVCKSWPTTMKIDDTQPVQVMNYGVTLHCLKKASEIALPQLKITKRNLVKSTDCELNWGITPLSDFHLGAYVGDLIKTKNFSFDIISKYLQENRVQIGKWAETFGKNTLEALPKAAKALSSFASGMVTLGSALNKVANLMGGWQNTMTVVAALMASKMVM